MNAIDKIPLSLFKLHLGRVFRQFLVLKKPVQPSMIFVRLGQGLFKSDYITRYLHTWLVLRLCIKSLL